MQGRRVVIRYELPTWALATVVYGGWLALTWFWILLPGPVLLVAGAWLAAWHISLQHEVLHGHPTRTPWINDALGMPPLSLWLPYPCYRDSHRIHHREHFLTVPGHDPESGYRAPGAWAATPSAWRFVLRLYNTLLGRVTIGPAFGIACFLRAEGRLVVTGVGGRRRLWAMHAVAATAVILWLCAMGVPLADYLILVVYPGYALALIRSFAEHRAVPEPGKRTAIVESAPVFGLLFLYNNLHVVHHRWPGLPWYRIPHRYRMHRAALIAGNGGLVYQGYGDVARRFLLTPHDPPDFPDGLAATAASAADRGPLCVIPVRGAAVAAGQCAIDRAVGCR
ncbi:MAG: fatty acid desaturase [Azospirillaceae bacterium]|nr:fatty acid desaturase [Azospirillaceae bacterium]